MDEFAELAGDDGGNEGRPAQDDDLLRLESEQLLGDRLRNGVCRDDNTDAPLIPATGAPDSASGNFRPLAMYTTETPKEKLSREIAADASNRSEPDSRVVSPGHATVSRASFPGVVADAATLTAFALPNVALSS